MRDRLIELLDNIQHCGSAVDNTELYVTNSDIADYLLANGVIVPPCKVGDTVYCVIANGGLCGGLIYTGHIVKRKVDKLIYDGSRWEMMSNRVYPDWQNGNELLYAYFGDLAFVNEDDANARLEEILDVGRRRENEKDISVVE